MDIAIIGAGQLGSSMAEGFVASGLDPKRIRVATRRPERAQRLAETLGVVAGPAVEVATGAKVIVIATQPHQVTGALDAISSVIDPDSWVVSLAGAPDYTTLSAHVSVPCMRVMPNPSMATCSATLGWWEPDNFPQEAHDTLRALLGRLGTIFDVREDQLAHIGPLAGHAQAIVYSLADAATDWGVMQGFGRDEVRAIVAAAIEGAGRTLVESGEEPNVWQNRLCTPGGTTIRTVAELHAAGFEGAVIDAMDGGRYAD